MGTLTGKLARLVADLHYDLIPASVIERAKICIYDALACSYAGFRLDCSRSALEVVKEFDARHESTVWISGYKTAAPHAAYVNSVMSNSIIHEDFHLSSGSHPGTMVIPVAFAIGEKVDATGKEILAAIVAGYEAIGRLGKVVSAEEMSKRGFRPTSILGPFGAAVTAGKLMGLTTDELVGALGAAGSHASGVNEWAYAGTDDLYHQTASASYNGIISAYLAGKGLKFADSIVEGVAGVSRAFTDIVPKDNHVFEASQKRWEIMEVYFKPVPACGMVQTTAQLALEVAKSGIDHRRIKEGVIRTNFMGKHYPGCDSGGPFRSMTQARMSNQYAFASVLCTKRLSNSNYEIFDDPEIDGLARKFTVEVDDEANRLFPGRQMIKVSLVFDDGSTADFVKGDLDHYENDKAVIDKFKTYCESAVGNGRIDEVCRVIDNFERLESVSTLVDLLTAK